MFKLKKKTIKEDAQYVTNIVEKYSNKKDIKILISTISDEYFLIDSENEIHICISDEHVTLSNHVFLYKKIFSLSFTDKLKKRIKENIEQEMQTLKQSIFNNENDLLSKVLKLASSEEEEEEEAIETTSLI